ncbi:hypothetical protein [Natrialba sp. SSL1]|uniref:hypothetical protein n=1 Tax=Natrialba sp. SSL1 TaxID=1869245 RepID=UPI001113ABB3|nr:hypothetical protein [Natrialba sp. SSL1]
MSKIKFDFDDDLIAVEDHDRKRRLVAARDDEGGWRILEGPIDSPYALSQKATAETANQVLIGVLRWLDESDE